jgi:prepilin-type N-terminal cleavage/methylation domain-containing protein
MRIISKQSRKSSQGFTLIEMIGVLAVIAILASMLVPKIFEAINSARINNTVQSYNAIKTAVMDHYGKYGAINILGTTGVGYAAGSAQMNNYDRQILLPESMIDKPFLARVGTNWVIQAVASAAATTTPPDGLIPAYDLDGDGGLAGSAVNDAFPAAFVVEAVIQAVPIADAIEISERLDGRGAPLSQAVGSPNADLAGRVIYAAPANGLTDVHIYICHR